MAAFTGASITGFVISGDGHVVGINQSGGVTGPSSAQAFGSLSFKVTLGSGGVLTAQAFGVVTPKPKFTLVVTGRGSAQAFGIISVGGVSFVVVAGRGTAQAFGVPVIKTAITKPSGGVPSAASLGTLTFFTAVTRTVTGLGSAQAFGSSAFTQTQIVQVPGLPQQTGLRSITGGVISGDGHVVGGSGGLFGFVTLIARGVPAFAGGVPSAAAFGTPIPRNIVVVSGIPSAQRFSGVVTTAVRVPGVPPSGLPTIVNTFRVGDGHVVGGTGTGQFGSIQTVITKGSQFVQVEGVWPSGARSIVNQFLVGDGHRVGGGGQFGSPTIRGQTFGIPSAARFGVPRIVQIVKVGGIPSGVRVNTFLCGQALVGGGTYEQFGHPLLSLPFVQPVESVPSAQAFGLIVARPAWMHAVACDDVELEESECIGSTEEALLNTFLCGQQVVGGFVSFLDDSIPGDLTLDEIECLIDAATIVNTFICGQRVIGGSSMSGVPRREVLDLQPVGCD